MIKKIDIKDSTVAKELVKVQIPSYLVEAKLINFFDIPPLNDTIESLQQCGESFYGYFINDGLCGAISVKVENEVINIHRLLVHPEHFRKGIAKMLVRFIETLSENCTVITVSMDSENTPAVNFYSNNGFLITEVQTVADDLSLISFYKSSR
ncbi:MAG: GNAT family N-acetyltransferase [Sporosarcina sp.]